MKILSVFIVGVLSVAICAFAGMAVGGVSMQFIAEWVRGNKEPLIPLAWGALLGLILGASLGLILGAFLGSRVYTRLLKRKAP